MKNIKSNIKLQILSGSANPGPPVGPILGQQGVNIMEFCKMFNKKTQHFEKGSVIPVKVFVFSDRSFSLKIGKPVSSFLLKKLIGVKSGSKKAKHEYIGKISKEKIYEIVQEKRTDLTGSSMEAMFRSIKGTAQSMGIKIEE